MAELIQKQDTLNEGRVKINAAITDAEQAKVTAGEADNKATQALANSESTQTQLDTIVINGDSSVEAAQARVDEKGVGHTTLKDRIDDGFTKVTSQLNDTENYLSTNVTQRKKGSRLVISIVLDDGKIEDLTVMLPIAQEKNVSFTTGLITNRIGNSGYMSESQIKQLHDSGYFEIISHSHNHINFRDSTDEEIMNDLTASVSKLNAMGYKPKGFIYPYNEQDNRTIKYIQQYFDYAFCRFPFTQNKNHPRIDNQKIDRVSLGSYFDDESIGNGFDTSSLDYYKYRVDECIANNSWLVFAVHPADTSAEQIEIIKELIDYIKSKGVEILTTEEAFNIQGNIIQTRDFAIDKNGMNVSPYRQLTLKMNAFDGNATIDDYPKNAVITHHVNSNGSAGFPQSAGTVITYNLGDQPGWGHQEYKAYASFNTYYRWATADGNWGPWQKNPRFADLPSEIKTEKNAFNVNTPLTTFPANKITVFYVDSTGSTGFPHTSGMVATIRVGDQPGYSKQIFWGYAQNFGFHFRRVDLSGNWGEWEEMARIKDLPMEISKVRNEYSASNPPSTFTQWKETTFFVNVSGATGMPGNRAGTVKVSKLADDPGYWYQEFKPFKNNELWFRYANDNNTWAVWEKMGGA